MRFQALTSKYFLLALVASTVCVGQRANAADIDLGLRGQLPAAVPPAVQSTLTEQIINADTSSSVGRQLGEDPVIENEVAPKEKSQQSASESGQDIELKGISLRENTTATEPPHDPLMPTSIAQSINRADDTNQLDLTPIKIPERAAAFGTYDSYKARLLYRLPARMFMSATVENSLRLETNVFQTSNGQSADMVYRVLPNVTLGYALTKRTRVAGNFFMFRDQYTRKDNVLDRNIYSVGIRADHDIPLTEKTTLSAGIFARELFFNLSNATTPPLCDIIPSLVLVRRVGQRGAVYASAMGQIRFQKMLDRFQEGDQFYSVGYVLRKSPWLFTADTTLVTNFGNSNLRGGNNNQAIIMTGEVARRIHRNLPIAAFVRAEPIFNMGANSSPGLAGFNFRLYGGLRAEVSKPAIFPVKLAVK